MSISLLFVIISLYSWYWNGAGDYTTHYNICTYVLNYCLWESRNLYWHIYLLCICWLYKIIYSVKTLLPVCWSKFLEIQEIQEFKKKYSVLTSLPVFSHYCGYDSWQMLKLTKTQNIDRRVNEVCWKVDFYRFSWIEIRVTSYYW